MLLDRQRRAAGLIALLFCAASIYAGWPVAVPLILGTWIGTLARPWALKLGGEGSGRGKAAGVLTAALLLALLGIFALLYTTLDQALLGLADQLTTSKGIEGALEALVTPYAKDPDAARLKAFAKEHGAEAQTLAKAVGLLGLGTLFFLFFLGLACFGSLAAGEQLYA